MTAPCGTPSWARSEPGYSAPLNVARGAARLAWIDTVAAALQAADRDGGERVTALLMLALDSLRRPDAALAACRAAYNVAPPSLRRVTSTACNAAETWAHVAG